MKKMNRTALFLVLTFAISFSAAGLFLLLGWRAEDRLAYTILGAIYMFIPALCVLIVEKWIHHDKIRQRLWISFRINKWFFVAWLVMPLVSLGTILTSLIFKGVSYNPEMTGMIERFGIIMTPEQLEEMRVSLESMPIPPLLLILLQGLIAGITINALVAFGEELGWRGFLVYQFREMNLLKAAVVIGVIWGFWHTPLILMGHNYPQHPVAGVFMMVILCVLMSVIFIYLTLKSKSVIAAAIAHGTMNATAGLSIMMIDGGSDLLTGAPGVAGFITLSILIVVLLIYDLKISKEGLFTKKIADSL